MQYALLIAHDDTFRGDPQLIQSIHDWIEQKTAEGIRVTGVPLVPPHQAATIHCEGDQLRVSDGPFTEGQLHTAAIELIECADFETAKRMAASHPMANRAFIEVRPVWQELEQRP